MRAGGALRRNGLQTGGQELRNFRGAVGDRDAGDYTALRDGSWDAVVDVCGYLPRHVGQAMDALDGRATVRDLRGRPLLDRSGAGLYDLRR